jgi:hypothetical protein
MYVILMKIKGIFFTKYNLIGDVRVAFSKDHINHPKMRKDNYINDHITLNIKQCLSQH